MKHLLPWVGIYLLSLALTSCVVHHPRYHRLPPPPRAASVTITSPPPVAEPAPEPMPSPEPPPVVDRTPEPPHPPPNAHQPPPPSAGRHRAPPAPPELAIRVSPAQVRRGQEVEIYLTPYRSPVNLLFNGRRLPKQGLAHQQLLKTTIPGDATSGYFEVVWNGQRYRSEFITVHP